MILDSIQSKSIRLGARQYIIEKATITLDGRITNVECDTLCISE